MVFTPGIIFIVLTTTIIALIGIIVFLEKNLKKKKEIALEGPAYEFTIELTNLKKANLEPKEMISKIDSLARKAINNQSDNIHLDYSQISEINKEKQHIVQFCSAMTESLYAGETITKNQVRELMMSLEDLLKGEGKIMLIKPKKEILENKSTFFLDVLIEKFAKKIHTKIKEKKQDIESKEKVVQEEVKTEDIESPKPETQQEFKKEVIVVKSKSKKAKEHSHYKYVESIDVLDRIQNKLKDKKSVKI